MNDEYSKNGILQKRIVTADEYDKNANTLCENRCATPGEKNSDDEKHDKAESVNVKNGVKLLSVGEVPNHLAFNQNIRKGYRNALSLQQCVARWVFF